MKITILFFIFFSFIYTFGQWSKVFDFNQNYESLDLKYVDFCNENVGVIVGFVQPDNTPNYATVAYYTCDGGSSFDSTFFDSVTVVGLDVVSPNVVYVNTVNLYPYNGSNATIRFVERTLDGGQTWTRFIVDTIGNASKPDCIAFFNDSVGVVALSQGLYLSKNYGESWLRIDTNYYNHPRPYLNGFALLSNFKSYYLNLADETIEELNFEINNGGSLSLSSSSNDTLIISDIGSNGTSLGYPNGNYTTISINHFPFTETEKRIDLLSVYGIRKIEFINGKIMFCGAGAILKSEDLASSFYLQESTEPDGFTPYNNKSFKMVNENIGYVVSQHMQGDYFILQKTINGGGVTTNYLPNVIDYYADIDEVQKYSSLNIYPNPSSDEINIQSETIVFSIEIIDLQSRLILVKNINDSNCTIDVNSLQNGQYILKMKTKDNILIEKVEKL